MAEPRTLDSLERLIGNAGLNCSILMNSFQAGIGGPDLDRYAQDYVRAMQLLKAFYKANPVLRERVDMDDKTLFLYSDRLEDQLSKHGPDQYLVPVDIPNRDHRDLMISQYELFSVKGKIDEERYYETISKQETWILSPQTRTEADWLASTIKTFGMNFSHYRTIPHMMHYLGLSDMLPSGHKDYRMVSRAISRLGPELVEEGGYAAYPGRYGTFKTYRLILMPTPRNFFRSTSWG